MILTSDEYGKILPQTDNFFDASKLEAAELRALWQFFPKYIGQDLTEQLAGAEAPADLLAVAKPAIGSLAIFLTVPLVDLVATNNGFAVVNNTNMAPASRERVNALSDALLAAANTYFDRMLAFIEKNAADFPTWNKSCLLSPSLLPNSAAMVSVTSRYISRHAFVDVIPHIAAIESTWMRNEISAEFLAEMQASTTDIKVKPLLQKALAFKVLHVLETNPNTATNDPRAALYSKSAQSYMHQAISVLRGLLSDYPTFATYGYEAPYSNETDGAESGFFVMG